MPSPALSWNTVRVYATWRKMDGSLKEGRYKVSIPARITNRTNDSIIPAGVFAADVLQTSVAGAPSLDIQVPATDDPDNEQTGWKVVIEVTFTEGASETYVIDVPVAARPTIDGGTGVGVNLRTVVLSAQIPQQVALYRVGVPGGLARLNSNGKVVDSDGNLVTGGGDGGSSTPGTGTVKNAAVAADAGIALSKTADSTADGGRLAMTTIERTKVAAIELADNGELLTEPGPTGPPGPSTYFFGWDGVPLVNDPTRVLHLDYPTEMEAKIRLNVTDANASTTPVKVELVVNGAESLGAEAPTLTTGESTKLVTLSTGRRRFAAGTRLQGLIKSFGAAVAGAVTSSPVPNSTVGKFVQSNTPVSNTSVSVPLPAGVAVGDQKLLIVNSTVAPSAVPAGWTQVGTTVVDTGSVLFFSVYRKVHVAADGAAVVDYPAAAGTLAVQIRIPGVSSASAVDVQATKAVSLLSRKFLTPTGTTDATTVKETVLILVGTRFNANTTVKSPTLTAGSGTRIVDELTTRGSGQINLGLVVTHYPIDVAATPIPEYEADFGFQTDGTTAITGRAGVMVLSIRPQAAGSPGKDPVLSILLTHYPNGFPD